MSAQQTVDDLVVIRRAASTSWYSAMDRRRELFYAVRQNPALREEYREWFWIAHACGRELRRLNALIARRRKRAQVSA